MAEGCFNMLSKKHGTNNDWKAVSAGLHTFDGLPVNPQSQECCAEDGIDISRHSTRTVTEALVNESDLIYTMTEQHKQELLEHFPYAEGKVFSIAESTSIEHDIVDPIGLGPGVYAHVYKEIKKAVEEIYGRLQL